MFLLVINLSKSLSHESELYSFHFIVANKQCVLCILSDSCLDLDLDD